MMLPHVPTRIERAILLSYKHIYLARVEPYDDISTYRRTRESQAPYGAHRNNTGTVRDGTINTATNHNTYLPIYRTSCLPKGESLAYLLYIELGMIKPNGHSHAYLPSLSSFLLAGLINQRTREDMVLVSILTQQRWTLQGFYGRNNGYSSTSHTAPHRAD